MTIELRLKHLARQAHKYKNGEKKTKLNTDKHAHAAVILKKKEL